MTTMTNATASFFPHQCAQAPSRPRFRPAIPARPASPLHLRHHHGGSRTHPFRSGRPRRRSPNAAAGGAVALWGWATGRRKRGRKGGGLDRAALDRWASILLLAGSIRALLVMQPLEALAVLLERGGGTRIGGGGGGDGVVGLLNRGLSGGGGHARKRNRAWKGALGLAVKAASAAAAAAAIWLLLFGKRLP